MNLDDLQQAIYNRLADVGNPLSEYSLEDGGKSYRPLAVDDASAASAYRDVDSVNNAVVGIYTKVPQAPESESDEAFPFITIGPFTASPNDTKDDDGAEVLVDIHVWSRSQSALTWRAIGGRIYAALQRYALPVAGANVIDCRFDNSVDFADPVDGKTHHSVLTFRVSYFLT